MTASSIDGPFNSAAGVTPDFRVFGFIRNKCRDSGQWITIAKVVSKTIYLFVRLVQFGCDARSQDQRLLSVYGVR